ncbi:MAG: glycosyltransferase [Muribaculaceae bacterium]|nr:glycosyltransferase [Muribaculaceae bacterium]
MKLEILICTVDERINAVPAVVMAPDPEIIYLVSWQQRNGVSHCELPKELIRDDIRISTIMGQGLSRNRNNALSQAVGDICLIADDDLKYEIEKVKRILDVFEGHPTLDLATFKYVSVSEKKEYPSYSFDLQNMPKGYYVCSLEMAFRRSSVQGKLKFNELMGIGSPVVSAGEDDMFLFDALDASLRCEFFPIVITRHDGLSTGTCRAVEPSVIMSKGVILRRLYPHQYHFHFIVEAFRLAKRHGASRFMIMHNLYKGAAYYKKVEKWKVENQ